MLIRWSSPAIRLEWGHSSEWWRPCALLLWGVVSRNRHRTNRPRSPTSSRGLNLEQKSMKSLKLISTAAFCLAVIGTAQATLIWNGSASSGLGVFKNINIQDSSDNYVSNPSPNGSYAKA